MTDSLQARLRAALDAAGIGWGAPPTDLQVTLADGRRVVYRPTLALQAVERGGRPVIVHVFEPASPWGVVRRLVAFRRDWGGRYHLLVVAPDARADELPPESFDTLVRESELGRLAEYLGQG